MYLQLVDINSVPKIIMTKELQKLDYFERKSKGFFRKRKVKLKHRFGWLGIPQVIAYRGFGSHASGNVFITGALTEDKGLEKPDDSNSLKENLLAMLKRYSGDQIPGAKIEVRLSESTKELLTGESGIYSSNLPLPAGLEKEKTQWLHYQATLKDKITEAQDEFGAQGEILLPGADAEFGVISDIDDTIMVSHSTQTLRKIRLMLIHNSRTRKPFPGVEAFYRALHAGADGKRANPFFYVSSSEWNLYDLIDDFCAFNKFPKGVFLLREINSGIFKLWKQGGGSHQHKFEKIVKVFKTYPGLKFVLVGDNGQHDPEIYSQVAKIYPERIKAIYIRTVRKRKDKRMLRMISELEKLDIQIIFTPDTINAAQHAQSIGLIAETAVEQIINNSFKD